MGILTRARDWVEEKVERTTEPYREWRSERRSTAKREANTDYKEYAREQHEKRSRGRISEDLYNKRMSRAEKRREKRETPWEERGARGATKAFVHAADVAYNPGGKGFYKDGKSYTPEYAKKIRRGRKQAFEGLKSTTTSYNKNVPSAWGLGTGKGKGKKIEQNQWGMLLGRKGGKKGGGRKGGGWGILYG